MQDKSSRKNPERKTFVALFIATAAAMLGVGIIVPILPLYARSIGASWSYEMRYLEIKKINTTYLKIVLSILDQ